MNIHGSFTLHCDKYKYFSAKSVIWYHNNAATDVSPAIKQYCVNRLVTEAEEKLNLVIANYPQQTLQVLLRPTMCAPSPSNFKDDNEIFEIIMQDTHAERLLKTNIFCENTVLEDLETLTKMKSDGKHKENEKYKRLYQNVISVGEYVTH